MCVMELPRGTEMPPLPVDVLQHVLSHCKEASTVSTARLVSKSWHAAVRGAAVTVECSLSGDEVAVRFKLAQLRAVTPCLTALCINFSPDATSALLTSMLADVGSFPMLSSLELRFSEVLELQQPDVWALCALQHLSGLRLINISMPAGLDLHPLASGLPGLRALSLVQNSKVAPLLNGDGILAAIGRMTALEELEIKGRMCGVGDAGLLALRPLVRIRTLAIAWVPWQSQITQTAALQLLFGLPRLRSLKLSGAELLLPAVLSVAGGAGHLNGMGPNANAVAAAAAAAAVVIGDEGMQLPGAFHHHQQQHHQQPLHQQYGHHQHHGPFGALQPQASLVAAAPIATRHAPQPLLRSMASAPLPGGRQGGHGRAGAAGGRSAGGAAAAATQHLRSAVCVALTHIDDLKLRFNCCGTGVEKVLQALGPQLRERLAGLHWSYAKLGGPMYLKLLSTCTNLRSLKINMWYQDFHHGPTTLDLTALMGLSNLETLVIDKRPPFQQALPAQQAATAVPITPAVVRAMAAAWPRLRKLHLALARSDLDPASFDELPKLTALRALTLHSYDSAWCHEQCTVPLNVVCLPPGLTKLDLLHVDLKIEGHARCNVRCDAAAAAAAAAASAAATPARSVSCGGVAFAPAPSLTSSASGVGGCAAAGACGGSQLPPHRGVSKSSSFKHSPSPSAGGACPASKLCTVPEAAQEQSPSGSAAAPPAAPTQRAPGGCMAAHGALCSSQKYNPYAQIWALSHSGVLLDAFPGAHYAACGAGCGASAEAGAINCGGCVASSADANGTAHAAAPARRAAHVAPIAASPFAAAATAATQAVGSPTSTVRAATQPAGQAAARAPAATAAVAAVVQQPLAEPLTSWFSSILPQMSAPVMSKQFSFRSNKQRAGRSASAGGAWGATAAERAAAAAAAPAAAEAQADAEANLMLVGLPRLQQLILKHCSIEGMGLDELISKPEELRVLSLHELSGLRPRDVALLPFLTSLKRLSLIAPREDAWLGLAPLRLLVKLGGLRRLDWVPAERALPGRLRPEEAQVLQMFGHLHVLTLPASLGRGDQLQLLSEQLPGGCQLRLMAPAYCEHAKVTKVSKFQRLISAASDLFDRATGAITLRGEAGQEHY